ncbi:MAG: hypothetical protein M9935_07255 [Kiritimatiellae bacterium]|nr:hypothetical protein [Kiritimatiellia bacterium]
MRRASISGGGARIVGGMVELQWLNSSGGVISQLTTSAITTIRRFSWRVSMASWPGGCSGPLCARHRAHGQRTDGHPGLPDFRRAIFLRPVDLTITVVRFDEYRGRA